MREDFILPTLYNIVRYKPVIYMDDVSIFDYDTGQFSTKNQQGSQISIHREQYSGIDNLLVSFLDGVLGVDIGIYIYKELRNQSFKLNVDELVHIFLNEFTWNIYHCCLLMIWSIDHA